MNDLKMKHEQMKKYGIILVFLTFISLIIFPVLKSQASTSSAVPITVNSQMTNTAGDGYIYLGGGVYEKTATGQLYVMVLGKLLPITG